MKLIKNHKTLTKWFSDLTLQQKIDVYFFVNHKPIDFTNLFQPEELRDSQVDGTE